eukprot:TRINITY_DN3889_c0_g2_i4.p2 TRINITY_DN3889_c0_g2~~TRINITY_DN3889_c0_g2_i4.p2  ORF type:complete len:190 (+),score=36.83 TRINITY_DN3889_c0_g2_i4:75-644(+)
MCIRDSSKAQEADLDHSTAISSRKVEGQKSSSKSEIIRNQLCPNLKEKGRCPEYEMEITQHKWQNQGWGDLQNKSIVKKCLYSHQGYMLNLEKNESKIKSLQQAISVVESNIKDSEKPEPIKPTSNSSAIMDYDQWLQKEYERELVKQFEKGPSKKSKKNLSATKTIWDKDLDELITQPGERLGSSRND